MNEFLVFLIQIFGYMLIFAAMDVHRDEESKIYMFDKYWFLQLFLVIIGIEIIIHTVKL
jgi:hypothetical protein